AASRLPDGIIATTLSNRPALYYTYVVELESRRLCFECYNTSWLSTLHERPGNLLAATWVPKKPASDSDLVVTLLHHPHNWLEPNNAKQLRQQLEQTTDVILTGHEHIADQYNKQTIRGEQLMYFEGAVLQDSREPHRSGFNVLSVDISKQQYQVIVYT